MIKTFNILQKHKLMLKELVYKYTASKAEGVRTAFYLFSRGFISPDDANYAGKLATFSCQCFNYNKNPVISKLFDKSEENQSSIVRGLLNKFSTYAGITNADKGEMKTITVNLDSVLYERCISHIKGYGEASLFSEFARYALFAYNSNLIKPSPLVIKGEKGLRSINITQYYLDLLNANSKHYGSRSGLLESLLNAITSNRLLDIVGLKCRYANEIMKNKLVNIKSNMYNELKTLSERVNVSGKELLSLAVVAYYTFNTASSQQHYSGSNSVEVVSLPESIFEKLKKEPDIDKVINDSCRALLDLRTSQLI